MILECENLQKTFGHVKAVQGISLTVERGNILGIIGPNGAGKSTLIKMITGLVWPDTGHVKINGYDVHREHTKAMRKTGAIIEWPSFFPYLSAKQNLDMLSGCRLKKHQERFDEIIAFTGLEKRLGDKVGTFSTGMKQRLGIALAMLPDSEFIILDEPTNGLDPAGIIEIRNIVKEYNRRFETTIIITSHLLNEIEQICHDIAIINQGKIIASGGIDELLHSRKVLSIVCLHTEKAIQELQAAAMEKRLPINDIFMLNNELHIEIATDCAAEINRFLHERGIGVSHLTLHRKTLEDFFMEKTAGPKNA